MVEPEDSKEVSYKELIQNNLVDFGKQSKDYSKYRPGLPASFYDRWVSIVYHLMDGNIWDSA